MKIIHGILSSQTRLPRSVLSIGNFDGLHRGHQQLLAQGALFAAETSAPLVVLTFDPHPVAILRPDRAPPSLCRLDDRMRLLAEHGVEVTVIEPATKTLLEMEPEEFIAAIVDRLHPLHVVEGSTFGFGRRRRGTPELLRSLGIEFGFETCVIDPVTLQIGPDQAVPVSSSMIRKLIGNGRVHEAALCLGRAHAVSGRVATGAGRGRGLGFPTANVSDIEELTPADGVYAGTAFVGSSGVVPSTEAANGSVRKTLAGISIGTNPTFEGTRRQVEAHLLDYEGDLVGRPIRLEFGVWLRGQRKFDSPGQLAEQIAADIAAVRAYGADASAAPFRRRDSDDRSVKS